MLNISGGELLIILLVALIFLGPERLPGVARQVGQTVNTLRGLARNFQAEIEAAAKPDPLTAPTPQRPKAAPNEDSEAGATKTSDTDEASTADESGGANGSTEASEADSGPSSDSSRSAEAVAPTDVQALRDKAKANGFYDGAATPVNEGGPTDVTGEAAATDAADAADDVAEAGRAADARSAADADEGRP